MGCSQYKCFHMILGPLCQALAYSCKWLWKLGAKEPCESQWEGDFQECSKLRWELGKGKVMIQCHGATR